MKYLALLVLACTFFAPIPAFAVNTCETDSYTCQCLWGDADNPGEQNDSIADEDVASCIEFCRDYLQNGDVDWIVECKDTDGDPVPVKAGTLDETSDVEPTTTVDAEEKRDPIIPILNVPIPGLDFGDTVTYDAEGNLQANFLAKYVDALYRFLIVAMAIVAVVMMMIGGLQYILARGHADAVKKAKERMANSVIGIILLLAAYNIAFLINPDTVRFESLAIKTIQYEEITAESYEEMTGYGQTGSVADADVITIPSDASSSHIIVATRENKIAQETYDALRTAASDFYNVTQADTSIGKGLNIRLTSASRTVQHQAELFYEYCLVTKDSDSIYHCSTDTCNPTGASTTVVKRAGKGWQLQGTYATMSSSQIIAGLTQYGDARNCYHTNNVAVDVWAEGGGGKSGFTVAWQNALTTQMFANGFCRIPNESWHFELATKASGSCSQNFKTADYTRSGTTYSTSSCKTWSYLSNCCVAALDNANKPATMCK